MCARQVHLRARVVVSAVLTNVGRDAHDLHRLRTGPDDDALADWIRPSRILWPKEADQVLVHDGNGNGPRVVVRSELAPSYQCDSQRAEICARNVLEDRDRALVELQGRRARHLHRRSHPGIDHWKRQRYRRATHTRQRFGVLHKLFVEPRLFLVRVIARGRQGDVQCQKVRSFKSWIDSVYASQALDQQRRANQQYDRECHLSHHQ